MRSAFVRNSAPIAPLSPAEIRECEERTGISLKGAKIHLPKAVGDKLGEMVGDRRVSRPSTLPGGISPNSPTDTPFRGGVLGVGGVGGETQPPSPPTAGGRGELVGVGGRSSKTRKSAKAKKPLVTIIEDTREQTPFTKWPEWVAVKPGTCHTGDYTVEGWENCFCIERKSLKDFAGTMLGGYEASSEKPKKRFNRELERMRHYDMKAIVVVASMRELIEFRHNCGMDAHAALWGFAISIFANYGIPVFAIQDEETAARWIADLARHYIVARTKKNFTKEDRSIQAIAEWGF